MLIKEGSLASDVFRLHVQLKKKYGRVAANDTPVWVKKLLQLSCAIVPVRPVGLQHKVKGHNQ